jgi:hypothetical protein
LLIWNLYIINDNIDIFIFLNGKSEFLNQTSINETFLKPEPTTSKLVQYSGGVVVIFSERHTFPRHNAPLPTGMFSTLMGLPSHTTDRYLLPADLFSIPAG